MGSNLFIQMMKMMWKKQIEMEIKITLTGSEVVFLTTEDFMALDSSLNKAKRKNRNYIFFIGNERKAFLLNPDHIISIEQIDD